MASSLRSTFPSLFEQIHLFVGTPNSGLWSFLFRGSHQFFWLSCIAWLPLVFLPSMANSCNSCNPRSPQLWATMLHDTIVETTMSQGTNGIHAVFRLVGLQRFLFRFFVCASGKVRRLQHWIVCCCCHQQLCIHNHGYLPQLSYRYCVAVRGMSKTYRYTGDEQQ